MLLCFVQDPVQLAPNLGEPALLALDALGHALHGLGDLGGDLLVGVVDIVRRLEDLEEPVVHVDALCEPRVLVDDALVKAGLLRLLLREDRHLAGAIRHAEGADEPRGEFGVQALHHGYGEGEALVSHDPICFYLADPKTGIVREANHDLVGKTIANKVLVFPSGKASSVVQIDGLFKLASQNVAPKAMIVENVETVLAVSAFLVKVPLVDKLEKDPFETIKTGDFVRVDAEKGRVTVTKPCQE